MKLKSLIALLVTLAITYFLPIPVSQTHSVIVKGSYEKALYQLSNLNHWRSWWPDSGNLKVAHDTLLETSNIRLVLQRRDPLGLLLRENSKQIFHAISVQPVHDSSCKITWQKSRYLKTALGETVRSLFRSNIKVAKILRSLQYHIEDPDRYYGYNIRVEAVADTFVLVKKSPCTKAQIGACLTRQFNELQATLAHVGYKGKAEKMFYVDSSGRDTYVMAGLSIEKKVPAANGFQMMQMPRAHIIVADFQGEYREIKQVHNAITRYMHDTKVSAVAVPYEKIYTEPGTAADSSNMRVKVYHPAMLY